MTLADAQLILLCGKVGFAIAGVAAGIKTFQKMRVDGLWGVYALATFAIVVGCIGLVLFPISTAHPNAGVAEVLFVLGEVALRASFGSLAWFVAVLFRPQSRIAAFGATACCIFLVLTLVAELHSQASTASYDAGLASAWLAQLSFAIPFAWSCAESLLEWRAARRRVSLGLATRLVANRFALWAIATAALTVLCGLGSAIGWAQHQDRSVLEVWLTAVRGLLYVPAVVAVWFGFFPPAVYRRWLQQPERPLAAAADRVE